MCRKQTEKASSKGAEKRETGSEKHTQTKCLIVSYPVSYHSFPHLHADPCIRSEIALLKPVYVIDKILKPWRLLNNHVNQSQTDDGNWN